jgi:hypothetical protein
MCEGPDEKKATICAGYAKKVADEVYRLHFLAYISLTPSTKAFSLRLRLG